MCVCVCVCVRVRVCMRACVCVTKLSLGVWVCARTHLHHDVTERRSGGPERTQEPAPGSEAGAGHYHGGSTIVRTRARSQLVDADGCGEVVLDFIDTRVSAVRQ